jgi:hypothetical protein
VRQDAVDGDRKALGGLCVRQAVCMNQVLDAEDD